MPSRLGGAENSWRSDRQARKASVRCSNSPSAQRRRRQHVLPPRFNSSNPANWWTDRDLDRLRRLACYLDWALLQECRPAVFYPGVRPPYLAPSPPTAWRRASRHALRCGQPACAGQSRHRHGSGERPCMQRRFPAASCRMPERGSDRSSSTSRIAVVVRRRPRCRAGATACIAMVGGLAEAVLLAGLPVL